MQIRTAACVLGFVGIAFLAGCASSESSHWLDRSAEAPQDKKKDSTPTEPVLSKVGEDDLPPVDARALAEELAKKYPTIADLPGMTFSGHGGVVDAEAHAARVSMFGEMAGVTDPDSQTHHGRGNIAQVSFALDGAAFDPTIDPTGQWLAFASTMHRERPDIYIKSVDGMTVTQITNTPADDVMPAFSPDGERLAFASNRDGQWDIYITTLEGAPPMKITDSHEHEVHPTWSPDGRKIAYCRLGAKSGRWEIWVVDLENPGVRRFLDYGMFPKWSPDPMASRILFQRPRARGSRLHSIWTIEYVGGEARHPTEIVSAANAAAINPSWSPDGRRIAFVTVLDPQQSRGDRPVKSDIWIVNADGTNRLRLTDGQFANFQPFWSRDGSIYFVSDRTGIENIWAVTTDAALALMRRDRSGVAGANPDRD